MPVHDEGTLENQRARYTRDTLHLNDRELPKARKLAFLSYKALLKTYIDHRDDQASPATLDQDRWAIQENDHPTVWTEMIRQREYLTEVDALFQHAPEALDW